MSDTTTAYTSLLQNPQAITPELADQWLQKAPYFMVPVVMLLKRDNAENILSAEQRSHYLEVLALNAGNPAIASCVVDTESDEWIHFYPPVQKKQTTTVSAIDTFLGTYGHQSDKEDELLERLIFNPVPDYSQVLEQQEAEQPAAAPVDDPQADRINAFIAKNTEPAASPLPSPAEAEKTAPKPASKPAERRQRRAHSETHIDSSTPLTASLAKIYIKQQKYQKAYDIFLSLSKTHPDLTPFYDDQLRFLRKLIRLQQQS